METWVNYIDNCLTVDLLKYNDIRQVGIANIFVYVYDTTLNSSFNSLQIIPIDRNLFTERHLKSTKLYYSGPNIVMDKNAPNRSTDSYIMELKQNTFVENDPSKHCVNYPNSENESYNDCDKNFTMRKLAEHYGQGLVPIWATNDLLNVTTSHYVDWSYDYGNLFDGTIPSNCPLPCKTTSIKAGFISRNQVEHGLGPVPCEILRILESFLGTGWEHT